MNISRTVTNIDKKFFLQIKKLAEKHIRTFVTKESCKLQPFQFNYQKIQTKYVVHQLLWLIHLYVHGQCLFNLNRKNKQCSVRLWIFIVTVTLPPRDCILYTAFLSNYICFTFQRRSQKAFITGWTKNCFCLLVKILFV